MQKISLLGATGSIGQSVLDLVQSHPERFQIYALSAFKQVKKLAHLAHQFHASVIVVDDEEKAQDFKETFNTLPSQPLPEIRIGQEGLVQTAIDGQADTVVCAIVGTAGLPSAYAAAQAGKRILLANKEVLVSAGSLFMQAVANHHATLLPLDSEHNAIFQCLPHPMKHGEIKQLILTASGGPFRDWDPKDLDKVTPEQACHHPNWSMGRKISVDSATMLNKGLEVIEAHWLFDMPLDRIKVLVHPQSIVHSLVHYQDGSLLAQLGHADMRIPISYAMAYPDRITNKVKSFELTDLVQLNFSPPDLSRYPCLALAYQAMAAGQSASITLNAANEVAVQAFLDRHIGFTQIATTIEKALTNSQFAEPTTIDDVLAIDRQVRAMTHQLIQA